MKVRFELPNSTDDLLRPEMYGSVELRVPLGERLVVPKTAVLDSGRRKLVFVAAGDGRLTPREVSSATASTTTSRSEKACSPASAW